MAGGKRAECAQRSRIGSGLVEESRVRVGVCMAYGGCHSESVNSRGSYMNTEPRGLKAHAGASLEKLRVGLSIARTGMAFKGRLIDELPVYYPSSYNYWRDPELTFSAANRLPGQLMHLLEIVEAPRTVEPLRLERPDADAVGRLGNLFDHYGSDKRRHGYHETYAAVIALLARTSSQLTVMEIGLGTNDPTRMSTMGRYGSPGASLRAFRDYLPEAKILGGDIDRKILFEEERISTGFVDQLDATSFGRLFDAVRATDVDLLIDDGLHSTEANLNTLGVGLSRVRPGGFIVIEDIPHRSLDVWRLVSRLLAQAGVPSMIVDCPGAYLHVSRVPQVGE
jgi:hypothetical protein